MRMCIYILKSGRQRPHVVWKKIRPQWGQSKIEVKLRILSLIYTKIRVIALFNYLRLNRVSRSKTTNND